MRTPLVFLVASMLAAYPSAAVAQCRLCAQPTLSATTGAAGGGDNIQVEIETTLSFDRLVLTGSGPGAVTIRPDGSTGVEGAVVEAGPRAMMGTVLVHGDPNRLLRIDLPRRIELYSTSGSRITLSDINSDLAGLPRLDASGNLTFRFGGRLILSGNSDGPYRGDIAISVDYR